LPTERKSKIQVVGGGFSGLAAAYFLQKAGHQVRLVEKENRVGGLISTIATPYGPAESAAHSLLASALVEEVAADLGVELVPTLPTARKRFIYRKGQPRRWPIGMGASLHLAGSVLPRFLGRRTTLAPREGETVAAWGRRVLGEETTDFLLAPALNGIYAGEAAEMSAKLLFGRYFESGAAKPKRGRLRGSVAPREGMQSWTEGFRACLDQRGLERGQDAAIGLPTVVALPPPAAADFLAGLAPELSRKVARVRMLPVVSITTFWPATARSLRGFGCLFPRQEAFRVLGVLANDCVFPNRARSAHSETWIFGGATDAGILELSDAELLETVARERELLQSERQPLLHARIFRWQKAIPHYDLELEQTLNDLRGSGFREGNYRLFGNYLGDLGLGRILQRASELPGEFS
jgi:protoporphyrinogen/coproporphyrinogen III oxidase